MQSDAERFLEARFEDLRQQQERFGQGQPMRPEEAAESMFGIMLTSLRAVGAISDDEVDAWRTRVRQQLGSDRQLGPAFAVQRHRQELRDAPVARPIARFVRMLPMNCGETDVGFGGRLQILGIELYDTQVGVNWRLAPMPDPEAKYADELVAYDRDAEGLDEREREKGRRQLLLRLSMGGGMAPEAVKRPMAALAGLTDDVGTTFHFCGAGSHGGPVERVGRVLLTPAPPDEATKLTINWEGRPIGDVSLSGFGRMVQ